MSSVRFAAPAVDRPCTCRVLSDVGAPQSIQSLLNEPAFDQGFVDGFGGPMTILGALKHAAGAGQLHQPRHTLSPGVDDLARA